MSSSAVSSRWNASHSILDHWRAMSQSNVSSLFSGLDRDELRTLTRSKLDPRRTYCDQFVGGETDAEAGESCRDGVYREAACRQHHGRCAILLSSNPGRSVGRSFVGKTRSNARFCRRSSLVRVSHSRRLVFA